jgi:hypothetical protein
LGGGFEALHVVAGKIIDRRLIGLQCADVLLEAAPRINGSRGLETRQRQKRITAFKVLVDPLFQDGAERLPNLGVSHRLLIGEAFELGQDAAGRALSDRRQQRTFLNFLARNIERQIGAVDQPANEAQVARQNIRIVGNEDAFDVKLDATLAVRIEQIERPRAGNEEQRGVVLAALGTKMDGQCGIVELTRNAAIEIRIIAVGNFRFRFGPQCGAVGDLSRLSARLVNDRDRHRHVAGLRLDEALQRVPFGVGLRVLQEMENDARATVHRFGGHLGDGESPLPVRRPQPRRVRPSAMRQHIDPLGYHEGRIKTDAEAADERVAVSGRGSGPGIASFAGFGRRNAIEKCLGAGARDRAEGLDHLLARHADAVVFNRERAFVGVDGKDDARLDVIAEQGRICNRLIAKPLAGVRRIGDQLA